MIRDERLMWHSTCVRIQRRQIESLHLSKSNHEAIKLYKLIKALNGKQIFCYLISASFQMASTRFDNGELN